MRLLAAAGLAMLGLVVAPAPALALTCMFRPFQAAGERFGSGELVAHVEVLEVPANRTMDARVLRVLHGREGRPIISIDAAGSLGWSMARQWGFEPFTPARNGSWSSSPRERARAPGSFPCAAPTSRSRAESREAPSPTWAGWSA